MHKHHAYILLLNILMLSCHLIHVNLNLRNFLLWKTQAMPCMCGDRAIGYTDGTSTAPPKELVTNTDIGKINKVINPEYESCVKQDQMLTSLLASISLDMLGHVPAVPTMVEPFSTLGCMFYSQSNAKVFQVRGQLANIRKNDLSANDYFHKVNELDDTMALEGSPLAEEHDLSYLLGGLNSDYNPMLSLIMTQNKLVSLGELYFSYDLFSSHNRAAKSLLPWKIFIQP